jgi:hypothetical protein
VNASLADDLKGLLLSRPQWAGEQSQQGQSKGQSAHALAFTRTKPQRQRKNP